VNKQEKHQTIFHRYREVNGHEPVGTHEVVRWAVDEGLLDPPLVDPMKLLADEMSRALRAEMTVDPDGRRYRRNHCVSTHGTQTCWAEMLTAPRKHMVAAFNQRRKGIVADCVQLSIDVEAYNALDAGEPVQIPFDFTDDVLEAAAMRELDAAE